MRTLTLIISCVFMAVLMVIVGCATTSSLKSAGISSTTTTTLPVSSMNSYPHADQNKWTYALSQPVTSEALTMSKQFNGTTTVNLGGGATQVCQNLVLTSFFATTEKVLTVVSAADIKMYGTATTPTREAQVLVRFPLSVGQTWSFGASGIAATVEAYEIITVPLGTYNAYRVFYSFGSPAVGYHYWFANNVGLIAFEYGGFSSVGRAELTSINF